MSRRKRILTTVLAVGAGAIAILAVTAILILQSGWFRNYVREKIVSVAQDSTGGTVEIGSFDFDWRHLRATIRNFVLHGREAAGQAPLFKASLIQLDLRLFSGFRDFIDLEALTVDQPQANILVYPDGRTNVPEPKVKSKSNKSGLETVVDLRIGHFSLQQGALAFNAEKQEFTAKGENLRAQLYFNATKPGYQGQVAISPLYVASGRNTPVDLNVRLPLEIEKDRIQVTNAKVTAPESQVLLSASVDQMTAPIPHISGQLTALLALNEVQRLTGIPFTVATGKGLPGTVSAELSVDMNQNTIRIPAARVSLGASNLEAAGTLEDPSGQGSLQFNTSLALGQLGRLLKIEAQPEGVLEASGNARVTKQFDYLVTAGLHGRGLAFREGQQTFRGISFNGDVRADPKQIALEGIRLALWGGEVTGRADLEDLRTFRLDAALHGFDVRTLAGALTSEQLPYDGVISGPVQASGDLKAPGTTGIEAKVNLAITPRGKGMPLSGKINAAYNGARDVLSVADSYLKLPNSRLDVAGSLDQELRLKLDSKNLNDFQPVLNMGKAKPEAMPVELRGGSAEFTGVVMGKLSAPRIAGHIQATRFALEDRPFDRFSADVSASSGGARVENGSLVRGGTQLQFMGSAGLHQWKPEASAPVMVKADIRNADLGDLMAIAGQKDMPVSGALNANADIGGTIGNPSGKVNLNVVNGTAYSEHFDQITANADLTDQVARLTNTVITAGAARMDLNATFQHPKNSFDTGTLQVHLASNPMALHQFNAVRKQNEGLQGVVQIKADAAANLNQVQGQTELLLTSLNANASAHGLQLEGKKLGDLTASAQSAGSNVNFTADSDFAGSGIRVNGQTRLQRDYPTTASASIRNLPIEQVLAVVNRKDIPAKGNLNLTAQVSGTLEAPQATVDLNLTKAELYQQPLDRVEGRIAYSNQSVSLSNLEIAEGPSHVTVNAKFDHPKGDFQEGPIQFRIASNEIQLGGLHVVREQKPGLSGSLQISADGAGTLRKVPPGSTELPVLLSTLNAKVGARSLAVDRKPLGDVTLKAETRGGDLAFDLDSDLGHSKIYGQGQAQLKGDYPVNAEVSFANLTYAGLRPLLGSVSGGPNPIVNVLAEGQIKLSGPALKPENLTGSLEVSKLEATATPSGQIDTANKPVRLANDGPIVVALHHQVLNVRSGHITGPSTDINLTGSVALNQQSPFNLQVKANTDLKVLQEFNRDIYSSGQVTLQVDLHGTLRTASERSTAIGESFAQHHQPAGGDFERDGGDPLQRQQRGDSESEGGVGRRHGNFGGLCGVYRRYSPVRSPGECQPG